MRLAIISSHPIQYNAPWFRLLAIDGQNKVKVFYTWSQGAGMKYDPGFMRELEWDIPLLDGYDYQFVDNVSADPGTHHFRGIDNPTLISEIGRWKPDAVLVIGWAFKSHLKVMRTFSGRIPVFFRGDSTLLDEAPGIRRWLRRVFLTWVYKHIDFALYTGENNKQYFLAHGLKPSQLVYAPHAVDNDRFAEPELVYLERALQRREQLGIPADAFVVMFAGKLEPKKNPEFIVELSCLLKDERYRFIFVGSGILESDLIHETRSDSRIVFLEFQNQTEMPVIYRMANVYILPSKGPGETWGLALNEAMASGIPVLASAKVGGAIDLIAPDVNGMIFELGEAEKVACFISRLSSDSTFYERVSTACRNRVQEFSYVKLVGNISRALNAVPDRSRMLN